MEIMDKYYASLREATNYLENIKRNYNEQKCSYNIIDMHLKKIKSNEEKLSDYLDSISKKMDGKLSLLGKFLLADIIIFLVIGGVLAQLLAIGLPISLSLGLSISILYFLLAHKKDMNDYNNLKEKRGHILETLRLMGEKRGNIKLKELEENLATIIKRNEQTIANLEDAIDHYLTILMDYESQTLPYGKEIVSEENIEVLEEGLKSLDLSYKGDE